MRTASIFLSPYFGNHSNAAARKVFPTSITITLEKVGFKKYICETYYSHFGSPCLSFTRTRALVFLRAFFFPSGFNVDKHVLQTRPPGGAVRHLIWGKLLDVPVPRNMNSSSLEDSWALLNDCKESSDEELTGDGCDMSKLLSLQTESVMMLCSSDTVFQDRQNPCRPSRIMDQGDLLRPLQNSCRY